jgi:gamma-glutamylaminecyclotransferase
VNGRIDQTILFVYGTLKHGHSNHFRLADQEFLGEATTEPRYRAVDLGEHPGLIVDKTDGLAVKGELWAVNERCLAELDEFEEVPGPFAREVIAIAGRNDVVFAYFLNKPVPAGTRSGAEWPLPSG